jgi:3-oxoacyl-[acyl-carrier protein] reductase
LTRRVSLITDANTHLGPDLARVLAERRHDLVLGDPTAELLTELEAAGASVEPVRGVADLRDPAAMRLLVDSARDRFGHIDSACIRTGRIATGSIFDADVVDLREQVQHNVESVMHVVQILIPEMVSIGRGQVVILTSAAGAKPVIEAPIYSATRAAANMLIRATALSIADSGVTLNAVGTNFLDYPAFRAATGADDPAIRQQIEAQVPIGRLGQPVEVAHFCASLLDGQSNLQTGQFFSLSGGWGAT